MNPINIKGRDLAFGKNDVVIQNQKFANQLLKHTDQVLTSFQTATGVAVTLDEIEIDHLGRIVISNPNLAVAVRKNLEDASTLAAKTKNGVCGLGC